jgi:DNA repair exonuclease SbcCD ATPase subunit
MRQIIFKEVGMKNYGPYIDEMILKIHENKLTLLTGPNGIGKTMLLDAIPFSLYGTTSKGKKGDDVVNNKVGKNCHTWLEFSVDDIEYRVDRYHKHTKFGNTVILKKKNGDELGKGQREFLPLIESLVVPSRLFMNTLFFGQSVKTFFTDLLDSEKKDIFRKILDLDKYSLYYDETSKRLKELSQQQQTISNNIAVKVELIPNLEKQLMLLQEEEKDFNRRKQMMINMFQEDIKVCQNEIKNSEKLIDVVDETLLTKINQEIAETKASLGSCKNQEDNELLSLSNARKSKENELRSQSNKIKEGTKNLYESQISKITKQYEVLLQNLDKELSEQLNLQREKEIKKSTYEFKIQSLDQQANDLTSNILSLSSCPTCLQPLDEKGKTNLKLKVSELNQQKSKNQEDLNIYKTELNSILNIIKDLKNKISQEMNTKQTSINNEQTMMSGDLRAIDNKEQLILKELESRSSEARQSIHDKWVKLKKELEEKIISLLSQQQKYQKSFDEYKRLLQLVEQKKEKISSLTKSIEEKQSELFDTRRFDSIKEKINSVASEIQSLQLEQKQFLKQQEILEFWKVGFSSSGIPSLLIDESIPFMNQRVSYYLDQISNGRYSVSFDTLQATKAGEFRDKISVNVLDNITKANSRIQLSGGQTRIVDIATILTLCDLQSSVQNVTFNLLLFDEIFDSLDDENIGFVSKVLKDLSKQKNMFIVSHKHIDQIEADHVISLR